MLRPSAMLARRLFAAAHAREMLGRVAHSGRSAVGLLSDLQMMPPASSDTAIVA